MVGSASKAQFLFAPELFLMILALVVGYYALTREKFFERGDRLQAAWAQFFPYMSPDKCAPPNYSRMLVVVLGQRI